MKTKVISILTRLTMMVFFTVYLTGCDDPVENVSSVSLNKSTLALKEGENETLKATVLPAGAGNKKITWKSEDSNIASVDQTGKVTAVKAGSAKVTVTTEDGGKTASCAVTVTAEPKEDVAVTGVTIAPSEDTNLEVESTLEVAATVSPANAIVKTVTWSGYDADATPVGSIKASDDDAKEIASYTIETDGKLTVTGVALGAGILTVTTTDGNHSDTLKITVVPKTVATIAVTAVTLDPSADFDLQKDLVVNLMATVEPDNATDKTLTWTSGDEAIVTVDNGVVTGVAVGGPIEIIVTSNSDQSIADTLKVTVKASVPVTGVTISPSVGQNLEVDKTFEVMAIVEPFGSLQTVTWSDYDATATPPTGSIKASDDDAKVIATYTMGTDGKLTVTGKALGAGILTVTTTDGGKTDNLNITVVAATTNVAVEGVTISPSGDQSLKVGSYLEVTAMVSPANATDKTVTWSDYDADATPPVGSIKDSNDKEIATYTIGEDEKLTVTGVALGAGTLTVETTNGGKTAVLNITVVAATTPTVTISLPAGVTNTLTAVGADATTLALLASVDPTVEGAAFTWSSDNPDVATVDETGKVSAVSHGTAIITADYEGNKGTIDIIVDIPATTVSFSSSGTEDININSVGVAVGAREVVYLKVGLPHADQTVVWSDDKFDDVSKIGTIYDITDPNIPIAIAIFQYTSIHGEVAIQGSFAGTGTLAVYNAVYDAEGKKGKGNVYAELTVTVEAATVAVTSVTINNHDGGAAIVDPYYLGVNSTLQVMAIVLPEDATNKNVTWSEYDATATPPTGSIKDSNNDTEIATYTMGGGVITIKGVATGAGTLTVTTTDGGKTADLNITVATVTISHTNGLTSATLTAVDATLDLSASVDPTVEGAVFAWTSSNTDVATVEETTGKVSAVGSGTATITATYKGITSSGFVVTVPTVTISLPAGATNTLTAVDATLALSASVDPVITNPTIEWTSDNTDVATVDATTGVVRAVGSGTATITADYEGNKGTIEISVNIVEAVAVTSVTINNHDGGAAIVDPYYLGVNSTLQVMAMVLPEDATNKNVTWSEYDATATPPTGSIKDSNNDTEIATYTMGGGVITIKGVATGAGTLTVTTTDGGKTADLNITVATVTISHSNGLTSDVDWDRDRTTSFIPISASVDPSDGNAVYTWVSDPNGIVSIWSGINMLATASGETTVYAMYKGIRSNEIKITVTPTNTITITANSPSREIAVGTALQLGATLETADGDVLIKWSSSNPDLATVSSTGLVAGIVVTGVGETVTITATAYDRISSAAPIARIPKATIEITVVAAVPDGN